MNYQFGGVVNVHDPGKLGGNEETLLEQTCADNTDISDRFGGRRRPGRTPVALARHHSGFATMNGGVAFLVKSGVLYGMNTNNTLVAIKTLSTDGRMAYEEVNNVVICSNGIDRGIIEGGIWYDYLAPTERFKKPTPPANHLTFYRGKVYGALGTVITETDPYDLEAVDQRLSKIPVPGQVGMLQAVKEGLWISTHKQIVFLRGTANDDFGYEEKANYPVIPHAYCMAYGEKLTGLQLTGKVAVFGTRQGVCVGSADGQLINLSQEKVSFNTGVEGSVIVRESNGITQIILSLDSSIEASNPYVKKTDPEHLFALNEPFPALDMAG